MVMMKLSKSFRKQLKNLCKPALNHWGLVWFIVDIYPAGVYIFGISIPGGGMQGVSGLTE